MAETFLEPGPTIAAAGYAISPPMATEMARIKKLSPGGTRLLRQILAVVPDDPAARFGRLALSPLLIGFAGWLFQRARADGIGTLYFLSREGRVIKDVYDALYPAAVTGIETRYLFASRRLVRLTQFHHPHDVAAAAEGAIIGTTPATWLDARFGVARDEIDRAALRFNGFSGPDAVIAGSGAHARLAALAYDLSDMIINRAAERRALLWSYLCDAGLNAAPAGIVDIGYGGSVQRAYSALSGQAHRGYYMLTSPRADAATTAGYLAAQTPLHAASPGICRYRHIYETLLCAPEDSVGGLLRIPGSWQPLPQPIADCPTRQKFVTAAHAGAVAVAQELALWRPPGADAIAPEISTCLLDTILRAPTHADAALIGQLGFDDLFADGAMMPLAGGNGIIPIWQEGAAALGVSWSPTSPADDIPWPMRLLAGMAEPIVRRFGSDRDAAQFRQNPAGFVAALRDARYRRLGRLLFGGPE